MQFDKFDLKILAALQDNGRQTDAELALLTNIPASKLTERRQQLEDDGVIKSYHAFVSRFASGCDIFAFVEITLNDHARKTAEIFAQTLINSPHVLEAHAMTEDMDFLIKIVTKDLEDLSMIVSEQFENNIVVQKVRVRLALETIKESTALPL